MPSLKETLKAATLAGILTFSGPVNEAQAGDAADSRIMGTDQTFDTYGEFLSLIEQDMPQDLKIMSITKSDLIDEDISQYDEIWPHFLACGGYEETRDTADAQEILKKAQSKLAQIIWEQAEQGDFLQKNELLDLAKNNPQDYYALLLSVTVSALAGQEAVHFPYEGIKQINTNTVFLTLKDDIPSARASAASLAGLPEDHIKNIDGTGSDWMIWTIGHETKHAIKKHGKEASKYYCAEIDEEYIQHSNKTESEADIFGAKIHARAQKAGLASEADIMPQIKAMRALGAFYTTPNSTLANNTESMPSHITSYVFDPDSEDFKSNLDLNQAPYAYELIGNINVFADVLAGFLHGKHLKKQAAELPNTLPEFTEQDFINVSEYPEDPSQIHDSSALLAEVGAYARLYEEDKKSYHYAAMLYLKNSGAFDYMRTLLADEYQPFFEDILSDYLDAVEKHGTEKLVSPEIIIEMQNTLSQSGFSIRPLMKEYHAPDEGALEQNIREFLEQLPN